MKIRIAYTVDVDADDYNDEYAASWETSAELREAISSQLMEEGIRSFEAVGVRVDLKKW